MATMSEDDVARSLYQACADGDHTKLCHLLDNYSYSMKLLDLTNRHDPPKALVEKTIYTSCLKGHYKVTKELLRSNVNPNAMCEFGTPIYAAVSACSLEIVKLLISYKADYKRVRGGFSPLFAACVEGNLEILKYLVNVGADMYFFTNPPLVFTACIQGHLPVLEYLMDEMEYDIHRTINGEDAIRMDGKDSLLYVACSSRQTDIANALLSRGAIITHTIISKYPAMVKDLLEKRVRMSSRPAHQGAPPSFTARWRELGLADLPWSFLSGLSQTVTKLELHSNRLTSLPDQIFQMPNLRILDVSQNLLSEITIEEVEWKCTSLEEFNGTKNQIAYVPSGLFTCPKLNTVNLSYNLLQRLPGDSEDACPNVVWRCDLLKKLDLSHNRLRALPDSFKNLKRLNTLVISYNYLNELPPSCTLGCINLVHLDAAHNSLKELPYGASNYWMHSLERLYLSHNEFSELSRNITELTHLTTLDVSHNRIASLPPTSAWTNTKMNRISLAYNNIATLTHKSMDDQTYTKSGGVRHNPSSNRRRTTSAWNTMRIFGGRNRKNVEDTGPGGAQPSDDTPRELPVDKWNMTLQSLYLQNNQIRFLPDYIGQLIGLSRLDVSSNTSINCLPLTYGRLKNCWELIMNGLDITNVPRHLLPGVGRGASTRHLIAYLKGQLKNSRPYNRMKLMAVGLQGRGKTTLLSVLRDSSAALPPNVSTVGVNVHEWVIHPPRQRGLSQRQQLDVVFSTWDLAGQEVYYATHQCFLSRNTLYLLVWNTCEGEEGIEYLRPWLLNIQARAPYSPVIIVGTHIDKVPSSKIPELRRLYNSLISKQYDNDGFPTISDICMVSSVTKEGIKDLQERIHSAALNAKDPDTHEHVIGMQVPSSYIDLQKLVESEAKRCHEVDKPPVLSQKEFAALASDTGDITDPEELSLAANFLHDNGVLLHYNDYLKGLNNLYFIDPVWLANMLAHIITVPQKHSFVHNGILLETHLKFIFRGNRQYPENYLAQYMQLLERFEIALSLGQGALLIPSMLPETRPALPFAAPLPRPRHNTSSEPTRVRKSTIKQGSQALEQEPGSSPEVIPVSSVTKVVDGQEVVNTKVTCVRRRLCMAYIPSGFWSRLISRLIINLKRSGLTDSKGNIMGDNIVYWRRGLLASHPTGKFLVESVQSASTEMSGVAISDNMMQSCKFVGDALDSKANVIQGVDVAVWSDSGDFSAMGYVVDQLDSLIDEWFPGLNDLDIEGNWLIERQALWVVPLDLKRELRPAMTEEEEDCYDMTAFIDPVEQDVFIFKLEDCALKALISDTILCSDYNVHVPLSHIVPDLLLTDLPKEFIVNTSQLDFDPKDPSTRLGRGGAGAVYRGKYRNEHVAIKEFLTQAQAESGYDEFDDMGAQQAHQSQQDESISSGEALFLFRDMRQEVTVLAQLLHPNIVALLGVSLRPMCICLELAPMGSLFGILDKRLEAMKQAQADLPSAIIRMPGGVLGHEISARIALQVALALRYLHKQGIVYRDLKSDNVLIWSLDVDVSVNAKLADYGISRFANPGGIKGEEGTPGYMAPEAIRRRGEDQAFDEKVDVFSFGMLLFELLTGQRPFETLTSGQEVNRAVIERERPLIQDGNCEPCFPGMVELMEDSWSHLASDRPTANGLVNQIISPGFLSRRHCITRIRDHPLQKLDTVYAQPPLSSDGPEDPNDSIMWLWSRQDTERNYSTTDVKRGVFRFPEKPCPGGRVYAMASTGEVEKRVWVATSVSKNHPDFEIQVFGYKPNGEPQNLWSFVMKDSVLDLTTDVQGGRVQRVFASLANGTICIFYRKSISPNLTPQFGDAVVNPDSCTLKCTNDDFLTEARDWENPYVLTLSEGIRALAIKYMTFVGKEEIWCACGNTISVVDVVNLKVLAHFSVFNRRNQLVNELVSNGVKVWGIGRQLSCVMEWDAKTRELLTIFDCSRIDPTGTSLRGDPSSVEELTSTVSNSTKVTCRVKDDESTPSHSPVTDCDDDLDSGSLTISASPKDHTFQVLNEPQNPSKTLNAAYNSRLSRQTLKTFRRPPRDRSKVMTPEGKGIFTPRPEIDAQHRARIRSHLRMQGATRTTSLLYLRDALWIARGMGDVLLVDVTETDSHGVVIARFTTEDSQKYGNKSTHKLCQVGAHSVVSSQWLEPLDMARPRASTAINLSNNPVQALPPISSEPLLTAHQQLTVWDSWDRSKVQLYNRKISHMLELDCQTGSN